MVAATPGNDLVALRETAHRSDLLGDLQGALNRLGAARAEEEAVETTRSEPRQHLC
jgi:hypothetical protein